jgi:hypothetical protein
LCGYGACDEVSGRRHGDLFYPGIATSRGSYFCELAAAFLLIAAAIFLLSREHLRTARFLSPAAWLVLGFLAASIAQQPEPKNYVLNVLSSGELDLQAPLRWHGMLRDEPILCVIGASRNHVANMFTFIAMDKALQPRVLARRGGYDGHVCFRATLAAWPRSRRGSRFALFMAARIQAHCCRRSDTS